MVSVAAVRGTERQCGVGIAVSLLTDANGFKGLGDAGSGLDHLVEAMAGAHHGDDVLGLVDPDIDQDRAGLCQRLGNALA
jgi:hypothetical protein